MLYDPPKIITKNVTQNFVFRYFFYYNFNLNTSKEVCFTYTKKKKGNTIK